MKKDKTFRPDRVLFYFKAEWLPLAFVTLSGLVYNIGLLATPWFEGRLAQCLADIHTALPGAVRSKFSLDHISTTFRAFAKHFLSAPACTKHGFLLITDTVVCLYKVTYHSFNAGHKLLCGNFAFRYQCKLIFPVSSQFRRFYYIRKYRDQLHSVLCRNHLLFLTLYESVFYQFFNNVSSGGRCIKSFSLHFVTHIFCSGSLHGRQ